MLVIRATSGSHTLVESKRPPSPTSSTATSQRRRTKCRKPSAVATSKKVNARQFALQHCLPIVPAPGRLAGQMSLSRTRQFLLADRHAVDLHPFLDANEVRRREQPGAIARLAQDRPPAWPRSTPCPWCRPGARPVRAGCGLPSGPADRACDRVSGPRRRGRAARNR